MAVASNDVIFSQKGCGRDGEWLGVYEPDLRQLAALQALRLGKGRSIFELVQDSKAAVHLVRVFSRF